MTPSHADLISRLEKATGPNFSLECEVAYVTGYWPKDRISRTVRRIDGCLSVWFTDGPDLPLPPPVTASVDAAIALAERLLPGWDWHRLPGGEMEVYRSGSGADEEEVFFSSRHSSPAIALVIATIRAVEAQEERANG